MLYDMISEKIDEYVFEPFLKKLFKECNRDVMRMLEKDDFPLMREFVNARE